jgi:transposase-like protein
VEDVFIARVDGLKGFPEAIESVYPKACVQLCIVHRVRKSLNFVSWKARKEVAADLKLIDTSATVEVAEQRLTDFAAKWDDAVPIDQPVLAAELGADNAVFRLPAGNPQGDLHHQRHRIDQHELAQSDQNPRLFSERRGCEQVVLFSAE